MVNNALEYIKEIAILTQEEWGEKGLSTDEFDNKVKIYHHHLYFL